MAVAKLSTINILENERLLRVKNSGNKSKFKIQRRLNTELPGLGKPGALERKPYPPGEHGNKRRKYSEYALHLEEKQKILFHYILREKQLRRFIRDAKQGSSKTNWVDSLIGRLERRLDNIVFRGGLAPSISASRQLVSHKKVLVNGKKINIPSAILKPGDKVSLVPKAYENQVYLQAKQSPRLELSDYLEKAEENNFETITVKDIPHLEHVPFPFDSGLFTEYYALRKA